MNLQGISYPSNHKIIARAKDGPFECEHCQFWSRKDESCKEKHIIELASKLNNRYGLIILANKAHPLHEKDCCDFFSKL